MLILEQNITYNVNTKEVSLMQIAISLKQILPQSIVIPKKESQSPLILEIEETLQALECNKKNFNYETDENIIEALIFEERSLLARYRHLMCEAKKSGVSLTNTARLLNKKLQG